jgi:hypothetical protein
VGTSLVSKSLEVSMRLRGQVRQSREEVNKESWICKYKTKNKLGAIGHIVQPLYTSTRYSMSRIAERQCNRNKSTDKSAALRTTSKDEEGDQWTALRA